MPSWADRWHLHYNSMGHAAFRKSFLTQRAWPFRPHSMISALSDIPVAALWYYIFFLVPLLLPLWEHYMNLSITDSRSPAFLKIHVPLLSVTRTRTLSCTKSLLLCRPQLRKLHLQFQLHDTCYPLMCGLTPGSRAKCLCATLNQLAQETALFA